MRPYFTILLVYEVLSYEVLLWHKRASFCPYTYVYVQNVPNYHSAYIRMYTHILELVFSHILHSADSAYISTYAFFTRMFAYISYTSCIYTHTHTLQIQINILLIFVFCIYFKYIHIHAHFRYTDIHIYIANIRVFAYTSRRANMQRCTYIL